jgi:hypothetical protein
MSSLDSCVARTAQHAPPNAYATETARKAGDEDLAERLEELQFLDTRRPCMMRFGN